MAMSKARSNPQTNDILRREAKKIYDKHAALTRKGTTAEYPALAREFAIILTEMMKEDPLFRFFSEGLFGTGSYHQKMRVKKPTEFDYDVELDFPVFVTDEKPGWARLKFDVRYLKISVNQVQFLWIMRNMREFGLITSSNFLNPKAVRKWFACVCRNASEVLRAVFSPISIEVTQHGPATTIKLKIHQTRYPDIDIDLVPVVCFEGQYGEHALHLCPKDDVLWRKTYVDQEMTEFDGSGVARQVVKLLKVFRDRQGRVWRKTLASYYLKTVVLHMLKDGRMHWSQKLLGRRFVDALKDLEQYLWNGNIPMFADPRANLLSNVPLDTVKNVHNRLRKIIWKIECNPEKLSEYFRQKDRKRTNVCQRQGQSRKRVKSL